MTKRLHLIRHGETEAVREKRYVGSTDVSLSDTGLAQAHGLVPIVNELQPDQVLSSPMQRVIQTATIATGQPIDQIKVLADLREVDFGDWEGLTFSEIQEQSPEQVDAWSNAPDDFEFPNGEKVADFNARIAHAARTISEYQGTTTVIFAHGGVIRGLLCEFLQLSTCNRFNFKIEPASLITIDLCGSFGQLVSINQTPYQN